MSKIIDGAIRFFFRFGGVRLVSVWYTLTMLFTFKRGVTLPLVSTPQDLAALMRYGDDWRPDPLKGFVDNLTHPTRLQKRLDEAGPFGDCDDHAIYWATQLIRNDIAREVWFAFFQYVRPGRRFGHVVCVWRDEAGRLWWNDYRREPYEMSDFWDYARKGAELRRARLVAAGALRVKRITKRNTPIFGKARHFVP